jgi:hypothetical protein
MKFRDLKEHEIGVRAQSCTQNGAYLVLFMSSKGAMDILDETVPFIWKREHNLKEGNNYCVISIFNKDITEWISKEDVGIGSGEQGIKTASSDAFKRAAVSWGIGRELQSAPTMFVKVETILGKNGKYVLKNKNKKFRVSNIVYSDKVISSLQILDEETKAVFNFSVPSRVNSNAAFDKKAAIAAIIKAGSAEKISKQLNYHSLSSIELADEKQLKMIWNYIKN